MAAWLDKLVALTLVVERNNTAVVEHIGLDTDTAAVVVVIVLVDTHTDSFSATFNARNQNGILSLNHFCQDGAHACESLY